MNSLRRAQKDKARQFITFTGCSDRLAIDILKRFDWCLEAAVEAFFSGAAHGPVVQLDSAKLGKWFDMYKESDSDEIGLSGTERFCEDLGVEPSDIIVLIIAWKMKANTMCVFTREEWMRGMNAIGCESIDKLKAQFGALRDELKNPAAFKDMYIFCFGFAKEPGFGVRSLPIEVADAMWRLTMSTRFKYLDEWLAFLKEKKVQAITKDVWDMLLTFCTSVDDDMGNFDEDGAWPVIIDEFVEWHCDKVKS